MHYSHTIDTDELIAAVASAPGPGGRGIVRLSGIQTSSALGSLLTQFGVAELVFDPNGARRYDTFLQLPEDEQVPASRFAIGIYYWPTGRSYTGQPAAEIHTIGSPVLQNWLLFRLYETGARPAAPGEFTLRSFLNGKINLLQAEAVLGVIDAQDGKQLDTALQQLAGGISGRMRQMRDALLDDLADLEAGLDFVEEDIEFVNRAEFRERLQAWQNLLSELLESTQQRMHQSGGYKIVLAGLPNAGKSTLFNRLTGSRALISPERGTTTDLLTAHLTVGEFSVCLYDTAGWEEQFTTVIDQKSQQFRQEIYEQADLILWCRAQDITLPELLVDRKIWQQLQDGHVETKLILTKTDAVPQVRELELINQDYWCQLSVESDTGADGLIARLEDWLLVQQHQSWEILGSTAARCQDALKRTADHLSSALVFAEAGAGDEFLAEELRAVIAELGVILGHVYTDDLLDRVFSKFCIGK